MALSVQNRYVVGLLLLTASTGVIDADSYLALDRVFTGNMTGNVLFIGFALMGVAGIPLLNNVAALLGFVVGAVVSGRLVGSGHPKGFPRISAFVLAGGGLLALILASAWTIIGHLQGPALVILTILLALVMGAQVAAVKPIGNSDLSTVVVTNTLANLARDSRLAGGKHENWLPRLLAVLAMGIGAALGALLIHLSGGALALYAAMVVYAAGVITLVLASCVGRVAPAN